MLADNQPKMNQRYWLNGLVYRIREVREHVVMVEIEPTRAIMPLALCDWIESGATLIAEPTNGELVSTLHTIWQVATGERQVADNDTDALAWIAKLIEDVNPEMRA